MRLSLKSNMCREQGGDDSLCQLFHIAQTKQRKDTVSEVAQPALIRLTWCLEF